MNKTKIDMNKLSIWYRHNSSANWTVESVPPNGISPENFKKKIKEFIVKGYEVKVVRIETVVTYSLNSMVDNYLEKLFSTRELAPKVYEDDFKNIMWDEEEDTTQRIPPITCEDDDDEIAMLKRLSTRNRKKS